MNTKAFIALLEKKKVIFRINDAGLAIVIGVSEKTFKRRKKNPGLFTIDEINHLMKFLRFSEEERKEALL